MIFLMFTSSLQSTIGRYKTVPLPYRAPGLEIKEVFFLLDTTNNGIHIAELEQEGPEAVSEVGRVRNYAGLQIE